MSQDGFLSYLWGGPHDWRAPVGEFSFHPALSYVEGLWTIYIEIDDIIPIPIGIIGGCKYGGIRESSAHI